MSDLIHWRYKNHTVWTSTIPHTISYYCTLVWQTLYCNFLNPLNILRKVREHPDKQIMNNTDTWQMTIGWIITESSYDNTLAILIMCLIISARRVPLCSCSIVVTVQYKWLLVICGELVHTYIVTVYILQHLQCYLVMYTLCMI